MKQILAILPFLFPALAAGAQEDVYQTLATGDRVQITFRTGGSLIGTLLPPPSVGPLARRTKPKPVNTAAPGTPFTILVFTKKGDSASEAQAGVVDAWRKAHPEATPNLVPIEGKESADLLKLYSVVTTPTIVLRDAESGHVQIQVGLQSAESLSTALGRLRARAEQEKVDFTKEAFLTLDVRLEYPGLNGTMSFAKKDIREVRKLQKLDEATRQRLEEEHQKIREAQFADEAARRANESRRTEEAFAEIQQAEKDEEERQRKEDEGKALLEKAEKLKAYEELLKLFPPDKWNDEKVKDIANRSQLRLPVTPEERLFIERQTEWSEAVKMQQEKEKKEKEKAQEAEKREQQ